MKEHSGEFHTHLFLARHGETRFNREKIVQGRGVNEPLNEHGRRQAEALAERAASMNLDVVFSSTLARALETAQVIAERCGRLPLVSLSDLEEMSWGVYEGRSRSEELRQTFQHMVSQWQAGNYDFALKDGESAREVQERGRRAIDYILREYAGRRILVVAHGRFLRVLIASLLDEYGLGRMEEIKHKNTALNYLLHRDNRFDAVFLNDISHLESLTMS